MVSDLCTPTYYDPDTDTVHRSPPPQGEYWVLVPGAPATCTQLGVFHHHEIFPRKASSEIDLVLSGPNHGRNTTAAFALSSGTLGGALEGAVSGLRAIAISFAFFTRQESDELVREASVHSMNIVEKICETWQMPRTAGNERLADGAQDPISQTVPDLYTINVPLVQGVSKNKIKWTWMLDNKWPTGSLYASTKHHDTDYHQGTDNTAGATPPSFKWSPSFASIWKIVDESPAGNDGKVIRDGQTSITPLKASFQSLHGSGHFTGELKL